MYFKSNRIYTASREDRSPASNGFDILDYGSLLLRVHLIIKYWIDTVLISTGTVFLFNYFKRLKIK